jgi:hypothetical protein
LLDSLTDCFRHGQLLRPVLVVWQALRRTSERLSYGIGRRH